MRSIQALLFATAALAATACGDNVDDEDSHEGPPTTTATPIAGVYRSGPVVTLTADEDATIYYTLDGSTPDMSSPSGDSPVTIDEGFDAGGTVRFFAVDSDGETESPSKEIQYTVDRLGPAPVDDFVVAVDDGDAAVTWSNPSADGFQTVVVARVTDSAATRPEDGATYEVGDEIPGGGEVIFVGPAEEAAEASLTPGGVTYMAWALYDTGNYSDPRADADAVALPPQTGTLTIDVGAGTVTVDDTRALSFFDVSGDNVVFDAGTVSFDLTVTPDGPNLLNNVKVVVTGITSLVDPTMTNSDGNIADGGDLDGEPFRYYGPGAMVDGEGVTRTFSVNPALVNSVFTVDFVIVRDRGVLITQWANNPDTGGQMYDFGSQLSVGTLPRPMTYDNPNLATDRASYRGAVLSWDGRFMIAGSRNAARVEKVDLVTMEVVGGLDIDIDRAEGGVSDVIANQARTRLYAIVNDGMHTASWQPSVEDYEARLATNRDVPDGNDVWVVEIDPETLEEVGRVSLGGGNILYRGRRGTISPDDRSLAVPAGEVWRKLPDPDLPDYTSFVHLVDLSTMTTVDTDDEEDGTQPIDLTGTVCATVAVFTADGSRLVVNQNYNTDGTLPALGAVIDLGDFTVEPFDPQEGNTEFGIKGFAALPDGRVVLGGDFTGLLVLDPSDGSLDTFGDYAAETFGMSIDPGGEIQVGDRDRFAIVDGESGDVIVESGEAAFDLYFAHTPTLTVY
jgi:hypothetical protein